MSGFIPLETTSRNFPHPLTQYATSEPAFNFEIIFSTTLKTQRSLSMSLAACKEEGQGVTPPVLALNGPPELNFRFTIDSTAALILLKCGGQWPYLIARFCSETEARHIAKIFIFGDRSNDQLPFLLEFALNDTAVK